MNTNWREALQKELDTNNALRQTSIYRVGDELTETKPCVEGVGRPREIER